MTDISGFQTTATLIASNTFPVGFQLSAFADDSDPLDLPSLQIADSAMGLNGDLITWSKANPLKLNMSFLPNTPTDIQMSILFEANRVGRGKSGARDIITLVLIYPNGVPVTYINGTITDGLPGNAISSSGRLKSKPYSFVFENRIGLS